MCLFQLHQNSLFYAYSVQSRPENDLVWIREDTWTDGPAPAGPFSVCMCPIKYLHFIPFYHRPHLYPFLQPPQKRHEGRRGDDILSQQLQLDQSKRASVWTSRQVGTNILHISHFISRGQLGNATQLSLWLMSYTRERAFIFYLSLFSFLSELYLPETISAKI